MSIPRFFLVLLAMLITPALAPAQTVQGRVTEAGSGDPVSGAIVLLLDEAGARRGATLSDPAGAYRVTAPAPGTYRLRVERVGYAASTSPPVRLEPGQTVERALAAESRRVVLEPVVATGAARRCAGELHGGAQAATLWDEARKALLSTTLSAQAGRYRFVTETRERETSLDGRRVLRDETTRDTTDGMPFGSYPAESLVDGGYVLLSPRRVEVRGVDAAAILSDAFLAHHCFGLRDGGTERPGLVGLEFVPLEGHVQPDVTGTLWIDRASAELRFVEYGYTRVRFRGPVEQMTGRLDFRRLPNGAWVTESWTLVIPVLRVEAGLDRVHSMDSYRIHNLVHRSGRVLSMQRVVESPHHPASR
ncbi:MAG TPA: carboxypeptidase-like regulatory domain-containing protein [Longimicrobium sp.]